MAEIELILMRQLAGYLAMPIFVVDPEGDVLFYNEPAEELLGRRFDEAGPMPMPEWSTSFAQRAEDGTPLLPEKQPLVIAVREHRPTHNTLWITSDDGVTRHLGVTAFPLEGEGGRHLGAVAIFWTLDGSVRSASGARAGGDDTKAPGQKELEVILMRQLASYLATPIMIADGERNLLFYNQPAEPILGRRFADTGEMSLTEWMRGVPLYAEDGSLIPPENRPLPTALRERRPVHRRLRVRGLDGTLRRVEATVLPLEGQGGRHLGGAIIFWELAAA